LKAKLKEDDLSRNSLMPCGNPWGTTLACKQLCRSQLAASASHLTK